MFAHIGPEALLVSLAFLLALVYPKLGMRWLSKIEGVLAGVARMRPASVALCGISALALRLALLPWMPIPYPFDIDEFSHLLAGDTFAHGRLANPTPNMWVHLEALHVIYHPTYASMYPPLQGLFLAVGQVVFGHPFWGVWLSVGAMCAAICWMLQAWVPSSWALLGGMLPVLGFGVMSYWDNSYWGGALAATGAALVLGAMRRIVRRQRWYDAIIMAVGIAMLANTRPYEGLVFVTAVGICLIIWLTRTRQSGSTLLTKVVFPMALVLGMSLVATSYYCWKVTGSPVRLPQQVNRETYAVARYFYWQTAYSAHQYHNQLIRNFYTVEECREFERAHTVIGVLGQLATKITLTWVFYFGPILSIPMFCLPWIIRDRRLRFLLIIGATGFAGSALVIYFNLHYIAPVAPVFVAMAVQGLRHLRQYRWDGSPVGLFLSRATVVMCVIMVPIQARILGAAPQPGTLSAIGRDRAAIQARLTSLPGPQLVLVRYAPNHIPYFDWVYNGADIDHAKVIWTRDQGQAENEELIRYYRDRRVWLLDADARPPQLSLYSCQLSPASCRATENSDPQRNQEVVAK